MASAALCFKVVVLLLLIYCLLLLLKFTGSLFCKAVLTVLSNFTINLRRKRELVALLDLCSGCRVAITHWCFFLVVPWVDLWSVIVAFLYHAYFFTIYHAKILSNL